MVVVVVVMMMMMMMMMMGVLFRVLYLRNQNVRLRADFMLRIL
jgi:hypothetical protein